MKDIKYILTGAGIFIGGLIAVGLPISLALYLIYWYPMWVVGTFVGLVIIAACHEVGHEIHFESDLRKLRMKESIEAKVTYED